MDLKSAWKNIDDQKKDELFRDRSFILDAIKRDSKAPLDSIIKKLKLKIILVVVFILIFISMIFVSKYLLVDIMIGLLVVTYILALVTYIKMRKVLISNYDIDGNLLGTLKLFRNKMNQVLHYGLKVMVYILPFSASTGFLFGFLLIGTPDKILNLDNWWILAFMVGYAILSIPFGIWMAKAMHKKTYGKYLDQLERNIKLLEQKE